jgi:endonuclease YncB( thermonuclease family)
VPYQGVGPDGQPITMYFAPTYVFTYQAGPPVPATVVPQAVAPQPVINRPRINRPGVGPQGQPTGGTWNYSTTGATPVPATMSLPPGAYQQYRPVYQFPADSRALTGTSLVPPGSLPQPTTSAFAAAQPVFGPPPSGWGPADASAMAGSMPPATAAIDSPTMEPVLPGPATPPSVPVTPVSSSPQPPPTSQANKHLWRVVGVYDGDTVTCLDENNQQQKVRLAEIDAPESGQDFGKVSREALAAMVFGRTVEVTDQGRDRYGRWIARLSVDGTDVNRQMVASGNAWVYTAYSKDPSMAEAQQQAQAAKLGLWSQDNPVAPWDYRKSGK